MSFREATWLTAQREVQERVRSRAFRASTAVQILVVLAIVVISALTSGGGAEKVTVATFGPGGGAVGQEAKERAGAFDLELELRQGVESAATARAQVSDGTIDGAIGENRAFVGSDAPGQLGPLLQSAASSAQILSALQSSGIPPERAEVIAAGESVQVTAVGEDEDAGAGLAFVGALLLYIALLTYGYFVSSGVVEEKSTRVVEVILATVSPRRLLAGKIVGIGLVGALQLALIAVVGLGAALASNQVELPSTTGQTAALVVLYFILGYAFYACAFATAGSLVSRQEDAQSTTTPITMVLIAAYLVAISTSNDPDSSLATVCVFLPPVAPLVVPALAAEGALSATELIGSVAMMVAATAALIFVAGRVYERAVLLTGTPLKLRDAWTLMRSGAR